jgi:hypothetical protein
LQPPTYHHPDVIESLWHSKKLNEAIGKMEPVELRADLKSEVLLIIMEKSTELITKLHKNNQLEFFAIRIMLNQIKSKTSPFYRKFRIQHDELDERRT